jgi:hypothetical protein
LRGVRRSTHLTDGDTDHVVQAAIALVGAEVKDRADDLTPPRRVGPAVPVPFEHDGGPVVGFDHRTEVRPEVVDVAELIWEPIAD